jgi:hypothetical protein
LFPLQQRIKKETIRKQRVPQLPKNQKAKKRQKELRYAFGSVLFIFYEEFQFDDQQPEFVFHLLFFRL